MQRRAAGVDGDAAIELARDRERRDARPAIRPAPRRAHRDRTARARAPTRADPARRRPGAGCARRVRDRVRAEHREALVADDRLEALRAEIDADDQSPRERCYQECVNFFGHAAVASWQRRLAAGRARRDAARLRDDDRRAARRGGRRGRGRRHRAPPRDRRRVPPPPGRARSDARARRAARCARLRAWPAPRGRPHRRRAAARWRARRGRGVSRGATSPASRTIRRGVRWRDDDDDAAVPRIARAAARYGVPEDLRRPDAIAQRLQRMLAHRPLLAPSPADLAAIDKALAAFKPRVEVAADTVAARAARRSSTLRCARRGAACCRGSPAASSRGSRR